tara:strand:+ start:4812 stop:5231 length:420 start_codon:yes stop_codon:yes gene_type:complete
MNDEELQKIRSQTEMQYKLMLYKRPEFPFLQSMGIKHLIQEFNTDKNVYFGSLHLWWTNEQDNNLYYSVNYTGPKVKGLWKTEWFNSIEEGRSFMQKVANDSILDLQKVVEVHMKFLNQINHKKVLREMEEKEEKILWN